MTNYYEINYDKNMKMLSTALNYCECNFSHDDIINILYNDDDLKKQICLIKLSTINNQKEADILVNNLIEHSGPIRETASFKILEFIKNSELNIFFQSEKILDAFIKSVTDINPSVSRNAVETIKYVDNIRYIYKNLIDELNKTLDEMGDIKQIRSYTVNKKNFNLYWNLEAVAEIADKVVIDNTLINILEQTAKSNDYTIREKTAKTAYIFKLNKILKMLENDDNIYVRKYIVRVKTHDKPAGCE